MCISYVPEMVSFVVRHEERHGDRLDGAIAPAQVVDPTQSIDEVEELTVLARSPQLQIGYFEIV